MRFERLGDIAKITSGGTPSTAVEEYYKNGTVLWVKTGDLKVRHLIDVPDKITQLGLENSSAKIFPVNTVLIAMYGATIGACSILKTEAATNQACAAILPNDKINEEFLYFYLAFIKPKLVRMGMGGGQPNISATILKALKVPVPSIADQIKIASLLSRAETLLKQRNESLKLLEAFLESKFYEMFGDPRENEKGWERLTLEELVSDDCPLAYGIVQPGEDFPGGVPIVRPVDLNETYIKVRKLKRIDPTISSSSKRTILKGGEILMCVRGTTGLLAIASEELRDANVTRGIVPIWFDKSYNKWFAFHLLRSFSIQKEIRNLTYGATLQQINLVDLRRLKMICPPLNLQLRFASIAEKVEVLNENLSESLGQLENLIASLNQKVFDGELNLDKLSPKIFEESIEEKASISDELDITIIRTEPPEQTQKTPPFQTIKQVAEKMVSNKPKEEDLLPFIQQNFGEDFFTFPLLKEKAVEAGWTYDFEQLKTYVFALLREGKLKQVFTDVVFEEQMREVNKQYQKSAELTEKLHLRRAIEL